MNAGDDVRRGQKIATVGTANGQYFAHLHFEMREFITPFIGPGYRENTDGWLNPSEFIAKHRGAPEDDVGRTQTSSHPERKSRDPAARALQVTSSGSLDSARDDECYNDGFASNR